MVFHLQKGQDIPPFSSLPVPLVLPGSFCTALGNTGRLFQVQPEPILNK
jgi:hypothetical protein